MTDGKYKPSVSGFSEIWRLLLVRLSKEDTAEESALSMYSNSGLFIESQVDILSSKEIDSLD